MVTFKTTTNNLVGSRHHINRIAAWFSNRFKPSVVRKQFMVHPCRINGRPTLVYERGIATRDPEAFEHLRIYAEQNGYDIKEDQRKDFIEGVKRVRDIQAANVMTIIVLTSCLFSSDVTASSTDDYDDLENTNNHISPDSVQSQVMDNLLNLNLDLASKVSETEMMVALLSWINNNSSFNHDIDELPRIKKVNHQEIAEIAFGKTLPAAVDPGTLGIKGLYNFNNKTIYILDTLDLRSESDRAILLHELVHFLQYQYGEDKGVECKNELEKLAYRLEEKYLHSHNHKVDFSSSHIANVSRCS